METESLINKGLEIPRDYYLHKGGYFDEDNRMDG